MRRRDIITLLGGAAAWPLRVFAQQAERIRRVGMLIGLADGDPRRRSASSYLRRYLPVLMRS